MKQIYKCEYCNYIGTKEDLEKHERDCIYNYNNKNCTTCLNATYVGLNVECKHGKDIPIGKMYMNCELYERKENRTISLNDSISGVYRMF